MRFSVRAVPALILVAMLTVACNPHPQPPAAARDPQTTSLPDPNANRSPDEAGGVTARDVDGTRTSVPTEDAVDPTPPAEPPAR